MARPRKVSEDGSDSPPVEEVPSTGGPMHGRLRADFIFCSSNGMRSQLRAHSILSSSDYDLEHLCHQGAQIDMLDLESGDVVGNLNEMI